ncbi:ABC transporter ATP-binding protein [Candidatus Protochlamydia phocaeensis]|uniref:ABC transporter ATP-binding protein n=1 Tax=Candidatus Protochlamydia phocaeensis TaxID=1414722 RepID=UPI0008391597|nr:ABC transporter ATP-binding protein [Candidatus Protochlamydia phocaeensis]
MKPPARVEVKNLSKSYQMGHGIVHALQDIHLTIKPGESLAIMGPSGSGKSTLLHLLGCLDRPTVGKYWLDEQDVSDLNDQQLACIRASKIGFVFQSFNLMPQLNVFENVEVPFLYQPAEMHPKDVRRLILESIERVGLSHRLYHLPSQLSGGETQRVAIARALAINPLLILADEPTGNLDTETGRHILHLFRTLNEQGVTLVMVTHDEQVGAYCRRLVRMRDGKIVSDQATQ